MARRKSRTLIWVLTGILTVTVGAGVVALLALDGIVRRTVEREATASLGTPTRLQAAKVSLSGRSAELRGLAISNPEGFDRRTPMFDVGRVRVDGGVRDLLADPVRVRSIDVEAPRLVLERQGTRLNVQQIAQHVMREDGPPSDPAAEPTRLLIDTLRVRGARVEVRPNLPGVNDVTMDLPPLEMSDIGTADGARNGEEIGRVVLEVLTALAAQAAMSDQLPEELRQVLALASDPRALIETGRQRVEGEVRRVEGEVRRQAERIGGEVDRLGEDLGRVGEGVGREVGGTLRGLLDRRPPAEAP